MMTVKIQLACCGTSSSGWAFRKAICQQIFEIVPFCRLDTAGQHKENLVLNGQSLSYETKELLLYQDKKLPTIWQCQMFSNERAICETFVWLWKSERQKWWDFNYDSL